jgi:hypothetical protein
MNANLLKQKADTNKSNGNACWWRTNKKKDPNAMDVNALTMEKREMLLRQERCFCCKKTGHMAKDCPPEQGESLKQKKVDLARFAYCYVSSAIEDAASETWVSFYFYFVHVSSNILLYVLPLILSSVLHVVSLPAYFHPIVSFNDIYTPIYLASYI